MSICSWAKLHNLFAPTDLEAGSTVFGFFHILFNMWTLKIKNDNYGKLLVNDSNLLWFKKYKIIMATEIRPKHTGGGG